LEDNYKIIVEDISKVYKMYNSPKDRFKEALSISNKVYHAEFYALTNISFKVKEGEILGIMGRNGAGKSTLLKIITGVLNPTYGDVYVSGRISSLLELGAGFNSEYTGIENIHFYCTIMGLSKMDILSRIDKIIEFAEIGDYIYQPVKTYSSGMFARLAFSCAINVDPDILIVDEILSVGDIRFQSKCFKKFKEFKAKGVTILYVGHDIGTMRTFCDKCMWLNNGKIVDIGDPTYISAKYTEFMYLEDITTFTDYKKFEKNSINEDAENSLTEKNQDKIIESLRHENEVIKDAKDNNLNFKDDKPIAHWGKQMGLIYNIKMLLPDGKDLISCSPYDKVRIIFSVRYHEIINYEYLSAAFSIKNREGTDLLVVTTYDRDIKFENNGEEITIEFELELRLTNGDYYLVLALEDRKEVAISYYEYIEGAKYFKVFEEKGLYGKFISNSKIKINEEQINED